MTVDIYNITILFASFSAFNIGLLHLIQSVKRKKLNLLSISVVLLAICLFSFFYETSGLLKQYPAFLWVQVPLWYIIGPLIYFHARQKLKWQDVFHFLPALYYLIIIFPIFQISNSEKLSYYFGIYDPANYQPDFRQYLYLLSISLYAFWGYYCIRKRFSLYSMYASNGAQKNRNNKTTWILLGLGILSGSSFLFSLIMDYSLNYFVQFDYISLSLLALSIIFLQTYFTYSGIDLNYSEYLKQENPNGSQNGKPDASLILLMERLDHLMKEEKLFRKQDLKINEVADALNISMHELSAGINQYHQNNFFDYINRLRVEELKVSLLNPANDHLTLFAIANASGFNSSSSFYRVFKKYTQLTPKQFIDQNKIENKLSSPLNP